MTIVHLNFSLNCWAEAICEWQTIDINICFSLRFPYEPLFSICSSILPLHVHLSLSLFNHLPVPLPFPLLVCVCMCISKRGILCFMSNRIQFDIIPVAIQFHSIAFIIPKLSNIQVIAISIHSYDVFIRVIFIRCRSSSRSLLLWSFRLLLRNIFDLGHCWAYLIFECLINILSN